MKIGFLNMSNLCRFHNAGYCKFGQNCRFTHSDTTKRTLTTNFPPRKKRRQNNNFSTSSPNYFKNQQKKQPWVDRQSLPTAISFDIDGTLVDINARLDLAPGVDGVRSYKDWDIVLDGQHYHLDVAIKIARDFVNHLAKTTNHQLVYLSGRRAPTVHQTKEWFLENGFPDGIFIHRPKGVKSFKFKQQELRLLGEKFRVLAHFGDRIDDDCIGSKRARVQPILLPPNLWITEEERIGGIEKIVSLHSNLSETDKQQKAIEELKNSTYWRMDYSSIIPANFVTDYKENKNGEEED